MNKQGFYLLRFDDDGPVWNWFDGTVLSPCDEPEARSRKPIVAALPDRLFFFHQPKGVEARSERKVRSAAKLQLQYWFPPQSEGRESGVFVANGNTLGYFTHPELADFRDRYSHLLSRAVVVTPAFLMAWVAAGAEKMPSWTWRESGSRAAVREGSLRYFNADDESFARWMQGLNGQAPRELDWNGVLSLLVRHQVRPARLRLALASLDEAAEATGPAWGRVAVILFIIGALAAGGQALRYKSAADAESGWRKALDDQYARVLGDSLGSDPYGKLLFRIDQLRGSGAEGVDVLGLTELLSRAAPEGFMVESFSLGAEEGNIRAFFRSYDELEAMLNSLESDNRFAFTLEQASNTDRGIAVSLKVEPR